MSSRPDQRFSPSTLLVKQRAVPNCKSNVLIGRIHPHPRAARSDRSCAGTHFLCSVVEVTHFTSKSISTGIEQPATTTYCCTAAFVVQLTTHGPQPVRLSIPSAAMCCHLAYDHKGSSHLSPIVAYRTCTGLKTSRTHRKIPK